MAIGKAKFIRTNGKYKAFVRNYFWQRWKPLCLDDGKQLEFYSFTQLSELIRIDCFDEVILEIHKFSGLDVETNSFRPQLTDYGKAK